MDLDVKTGDFIENLNRKNRKNGFQRIIVENEIILGFFYILKDKRMLQEQFQAEVDKIRRRLTD